MHSKAAAWRRMLQVAWETHPPSCSASSQGFQVVLEIFSLEACIMQEASRKTEEVNGTACLFMLPMSPRWQRGLLKYQLCAIATLTSCRFASPLAVLCDWLSGHKCFLLF